MAEEALAVETTTLTTTITTTTTEDMDLESVLEPVPEPESGNDDSQLKRLREEEEENGDGAKKLKVEEDKSVEEQRYEKLEGGCGGDNEEEEEEEKGSDRVTLGLKSFGSGVEMFDYFFKFLHLWSPIVNVNKVVLDGYSAPLTSGHFVKLVNDGAYNGSKLTCTDQAIISDSTTDKTSSNGMPLEIMPAG